MLTTTPILLLFLLLLLPPTIQGINYDHPHMVIFMVDDMGWSDVGFKDSAMHTPNIDALANEGVIMDQSYMMKSCSPSRSSFLTGYYAWKMGMQDTSLTSSENDSLPLDKRLFPQELQAHNYSTHYVGKWHLGFCKREMTPTYRGFDTFYGKYNGKGDHFSHISKKNGYDLQDNVGLDDFKVDPTASGTYSTTLFTNKAIDIIKNHDKRVPLFLFISYQAVHGPFQVPNEYIKEGSACGNITCEARKIQCGMMSAIDEGVGKVRAILERKGYDRNLIMLFLSDNGGPVGEGHEGLSGSSNLPLRGGKTTEWEGGTRVTSILHSDQYLPRNVTWKGLFHVVDWYPTLLGAANIAVIDSAMDGKNQWCSIVNQFQSERDEFVYNINEVKGNYALRWKEFKLVKFDTPRPNGWYEPCEDADEPRANKEWMLFDLDKDPTEQHDISEANCKTRNTVVRMKEMLDGYREQLVLTRDTEKLSAGLPEYNHGNWTSGWC